MSPTQQQPAASSSSSIISSIASSKITTNCYYNKKKVVYYHCRRRSMEVVICYYFQQPNLHSNFGSISHIKQYIKLTLLVLSAVIAAGVLPLLLIFCCCSPLFANRLALCPDTTPGTYIYCRRWIEYSFFFFCLLHLSRCYHYLSCSCVVALLLLLPMMMMIMLLNMIWHPLYHSLLYSEINYCPIN